MTTYSIGQTLSGGYRVIDVKAGGMGVVYICHQSGTDQFYAIKTVKFQSGAGSEELARRFRNEVFEWIKISNQRKHDNVVQALLYNQDERWLFLEFVDGLPMHQAIPKCPAHLRHAVDWGRGIAAGMDSLHREFSYIHRDLKPQNVMIQSEGLVPKITDLGIGKVIQEGAGEHTLIGTPGYMAPEAFHGQADFRTDVYAYGGMFYRLVAGEAPFGRGAPAFDKPPPPPSEMWSARNGGESSPIPAEIDKLILRCLEPDPKKRIPSFDDILSELDQLPTILDEASDRYRYCREHQFFSPIGAELPECLFCDNTSQHRERLEAATGSVEDFPTQAMQEGGGTAGVTAAENADTIAQTASAPAEETATARIAPTSTPVAVAVAAPAVPAPAPVAPSRRGLWIALFVVLGCGAAAGVKFWPSEPKNGSNGSTRNGGDGTGNGGGTPDGPTPNVPPPTPPENGGPSPEVVPGTEACQAAGCDRSFVAEELRYTNERGETVKWNQNICGFEDHRVCTVCGARYFDKSSFDSCDVCGKARKIIRIKDRSP